MHGRKQMNMTAEQFKALTGFEDTQDDLERVNCPKAGQPGHESCGLNSYGLPRFMGRNLKPEDLPINQK